MNTAYQNFFREHKKGNTNQGFPKFKSKKNNYKSYRTNFTNNNIEIDFEKGQIKLPKLKWIKCKTHRKFTGKILSATISQVPSGKYYVSLKIAKLHEKITNIRVDNLHKISSQIGYEVNEAGNSSSDARSLSL